MIYIIKFMLKLKKKLQNFCKFKNLQYKYKLLRRMINVNELTILFITHTLNIKVFTANY